MTVRLAAVPEWAERCIVEPVTTLDEHALALPGTSSPSRRHR